MCASTVIGQPSANKGNTLHINICVRARYLVNLPPSRVTPHTSTCVRRRGTWSTLHHQGQHPAHQLLRAGALLGQPSPIKGNTLLINFYAQAQYLANLPPSRATPRTSTFVHRRGAGAVLGPPSTIKGNTLHINFCAQARYLVNLPPSRATPRTSTFVRRRGAWSTFRHQG